MVDLRLLRDRCSGRECRDMVSFVGFPGPLFLMPLLLQAEIGLSPVQSGLTTFPQAFGVAMMSQPPGRLYRYGGPRRMMTRGLLAAGLATNRLLVNRPEHEPVVIRAIILLRGWSFAFTDHPAPGGGFSQPSAPKIPAGRPPSSTPASRSPPALASPYWLRR